MADLIDIVPPIEPQPLETAIDFSWLMIIFAFVIVIGLWRWFTISKAWLIWQRLNVWQSQRAQASLWQLVDIVQQWHSQISRLPEAKRQPVKRILQQITFFASQRDKLSVEQQQQVFDSVNHLQKTYWRLVFSVYWVSCKQPLQKLWRALNLRLQQLKSNHSAGPKNGR